ncbi:MAG: dihydrofolate reductase family protein [Pseudonocardia sediminis]
MRKIIAGEFVSLDGVAEAPETWHMSYFTDELGAAVGSIMQPEMLLGRVTWTGFGEHFGPLTDDPMADGMNTTPKYVVSTTLDSADAWQNSTLLGGDWVQRLREIKASDGPDIGVSGSLTLVRALLAHGLLDELHLMVHPLVVGKGAKLFPDGTDGVALTLLRSSALSSGVLHTVYGPTAG